jgi:hypothetical protein
MNNYEMNLKFSELLKEVTELKSNLDKLLSIVKPEEDLWDNSDVIRNWKVSERTLSDWRKNGLIGYVQVNGKIWYPRSVRNKFLDQHLVTDGYDNVQEDDFDDDWVVYINNGGQNHGN